MMMMMMTMEIVVVVVLLLRMTVFLQRERIVIHLKSVAPYLVDNSV